jgi:uncharacterized linocin/CFP29 family protein
VNHLHREIAPLDDEAWSQVDTDARTRLVTYLAGRRLVDFRGPLGWKHAAVSLGRVAALSDVSSAAEPGVEAGLRQVLPLAEVRVPFTLSRRALDDAARGNDSIDLEGLDDAARTMAILENKAVFHGWAGAGITGMTEASSHPPVSLGGADVRNYPKLVATAVERLALAGIGGPYALALGDDAWVDVVGSTERGSTLLSHLGRLLEGGPIVWAPGVEGAVVSSQRGGDFELVSGQDLAIGYRSCDLDTLTLYLEESFTFRVLEPDAAVAVALTE